MSDLSSGAGGMPAGWGMPSPLFNHQTHKYESDGVVWLSDDRCTMSDIEALKDALGENVNIDIATVFGGKSFRDRNKDFWPYKQKVYL
jgi:hypothetical protein